MFLVGYHRNPNYHEKTTKWTGDLMREEVVEECLAKPVLKINQIIC